VVRFAIIMEFKFVLFCTVILLYFLVFGVMGDDPVSNSTESERRKSRDVAPYLGLISCAIKYDVTCFVNAAEDYLEVRRNELLGEFTRRKQVKFIYIRKSQNNTN